MYDLDQRLEIQRKIRYLQEFNERVRQFAVAFRDYLRQQESLREREERLDREAAASIPKLNSSGIPREGFNPWDQAVAQMQSEEALVEEQDKLDDELEGQDEESPLGTFRSPLKLSRKLRQALQGYPGPRARSSDDPPPSIAPLPKAISDPAPPFDPASVPTTGKTYEEILNTTQFPQSERNYWAPIPHDNENFEMMLDGVNVVLPGAGTAVSRATRTLRAADKARDARKAGKRIGEPTAKKLAENLSKKAGQETREQIDRALHKQEDQPPAGAVEKQKTHEHHSDAKFAGGDPKQPTTTLEEGVHQDLHKALNQELHKKANDQGQHMRPQRGNSGRTIRQNFSREELLEAQAEFYRRFRQEFPDAASDFFRQHPGLE